MTLTGTSDGVARRVLGLIGALAALTIVVLCSIAVGTKPIPLRTVLDALFHYDAGSNDHLIVRSLRVPRTILDLLVDLDEREQRTIVLVLHDLNQAARYSHHLIAMSAGRVVACGSPVDVITEARVEDVFGLHCRVLTDPVSGTPMVVPIGRHSNVAAVS